MLGEQVKTVLIPLAGFDSVLKGSLCCQAQRIGTGRQAGGSCLSVGKTEMASRSSTLLIWLESVHLSSSADR